jgi:carboxylesterase type B
MRIETFLTQINSHRKESQQGNAQGWYFAAHRGMRPHAGGESQCLRWGRPVVQIAHGQLQRAAAYGMRAFRDIPYAAPPALGAEAKQNRWPVGNRGVMDQIAAQRLFQKAIAESAQQTPLRDLSQEGHGLPPGKLFVSAQEFQQGEGSGSFIDGDVIIRGAVPLCAAGKEYKIPFMIGIHAWNASFFVSGEPPLGPYLAKMGEDTTTINKLCADFGHSCVLSAEVMADAWYRGIVKLLADSAGRQVPSYSCYFSYLTRSIRASHTGAADTFEIPHVFGAISFVMGAGV